jgi:hypothetical protein
MNRANRMQPQYDGLMADVGSMEPAPDSGDLATNELAAEAVRSLGYLRLRVTGSSMLPTIWPGEVLCIRRSSIDEAGVGEVVLFIRHRRLFAHRVIACSGARLTTQGDAVAAPDPPVDASELLGIVDAVLRQGHPVPIRSGMTWYERLTAFVIRRSAMARRLLIRLHGPRERASP